MKEIDFSKWKPENIRKFKYLSKVRKGDRLFTNFGSNEWVEVVSTNGRCSMNRAVRTIVVRFSDGTLKRFNLFGNLILNRFGDFSPECKCYLYKDESLTW